MSERRVRSVEIAGTGAYLPEKVLTNHDLEKMVDTTDEWITTRTGIKERRIVHEEAATSDMASEAARIALKDAGVDAEQVEVMIVATVTGDMSFPSTSCVMQNKIGAKNAVCFDIGAACSGFIYAMSVASGFILSEQYKNVLVIGSESLSRFTDWTDRSTCVLFGDGAGAFFLRGSESNEKGIISTYLGSDGSLGDLLCLPAGGSKMPATHETVDNKLHYLKMNGNEVFKHAVRLMEKSVRAVLEKANLKVEDIDFLVPHQANIRIMNAVAKRLGFEEERVFVNVDKCGNVSAASTPIAVDELLRSGRVKPGSTIVMVAFGSGFTWASAVIKV